MTEFSLAVAVRTKKAGFSLSSLGVFLHTAVAEGVAVVHSYCAERLTLSKPVLSHR
jgi:hypothetical protein